MSFNDDEWDYAQLTSAAKDAGGPQKLIDNIRAEERNKNDEDYKAKEENLHKQNLAYWLLGLTAGVILTYGIPRGIEIINKFKNKKRLTNNQEDKKVYKIVMIYEDGTKDEQAEEFDTRAEAEDYAGYLCGCVHQGAEIMHMSNPGDYSDEDEEVDYEIIEV